MIDSWILDYDLKFANTNVNKNPRHPEMSSLTTANYNKYAQVHLYKQQIGTNSAKWIYLIVASCTEAAYKSLFSVPSAIQLYFIVLSSHIDPPHGNAHGLHSPDLPLDN